MGRIFCRCRVRGGGGGGDLGNVLVERSDWLTVFVIVVVVLVPVNKF